MRTKVTVIIPAYNAAEFLREAIDSVLGQTFRNFEILVIDDGSTDSTANIALSFGDQIQLIRTTNRGVARARNSGLQAATGEYVAFLDSDDVWEPDKLARQIEATNEGYRFVYTDTVSFGDSGLSGLSMSAGGSLPSGSILDQLVERNFIATSGVLLERELALRTGGFDPEIAVGEDWDMWLRAANMAPVKCIPEPLVRYRVRSGSLGSEPELRVDACAKVISSGLGMLSLSKSDKERLRKRAFSGCLTYSALIAENDGRADLARRLRLRALVLKPSSATLKDYVKDLLGPALVNRVSTLLRKRA